MIIRLVTSYQIKIRFEVHFNELWPIVCLWAEAYRRLSASFSTPLGLLA